MQNDSDNKKVDSSPKKDVFSEITSMVDIINSPNQPNISHNDAKNSLNKPLNDSENLSTLTKNFEQTSPTNNISDEINTEFKTEIYQNYNVIPTNTDGFCIPSLNPNGSKDSVFDCLLIRKALENHECDKEIIRNILARRTSNQRENLQIEYEKTYSASLIDTLKSKTKDPYERILVSLLYRGSDLDAYTIHKASKVIGTDESIYRFILCTRSHQQICLIKESYQKIFNQSLESQIRSETSGSCQEILLNLIKESRTQNNNVDVSLIIQDVVGLVSTSVLELTAPNSLIPLFCGRSYSHLLRTFYEYKKKTGHSVNKYLKKFISSEFQKCLISIYHFIKNPVRFYTKYLKDGINKKNIYHITLVVVTRCEIDLTNILDDYKKKYNTDFLQDLKSVFVSHEYKDILETIIILCGES